MDLETWISGVPGLEAAALLLVRVATGVFFAATGAGKVFRAEKREQMRETLEQAGVPWPAANASFVSAVELGGGVLLIVGLLTPLAAAALAVVMAVAIATTRVRSVEGRGLQWWTNLLYLPESVYLLLLLWIASAGAGPFSLDALIA